MSDFVFTVEDNPEPNDVRVLISKIVNFNNNSQQYDDIAYPLSVFMRNAKAEIVGGLVGKIHWGWLFVSHLWVDETLRGQGYGKQILLKAEQAAKQRGCNYAYLDTFSFQALGFYQSLGYQIFGVLDNFPPGNKKYFLQKQI